MARSSRALPETSATRRRRLPQKLEVQRTLLGTDQSQRRIAKIHSELVHVGLGEFQIIEIILEILQNIMPIL